MIAKLADGSYPFIDQRLPLLEMTMVEAPAELEALFKSQAVVNGIEILRDTPVELRCRSVDYPDCWFRSKSPAVPRFIRPPFRFEFAHRSEMISPTVPG